MNGELKVDKATGSVSREGGRELGPEMRAEGWNSLGGEHTDCITWYHGPSHRSVSVDDYPWENTSGIPALHGEPADPKTPGYVVSCRVHDELGNPIEGDSFWVESFGEALRWARRIRTEILAEHPSAIGTQLTFDDLVERPAA